MQYCPKCGSPMPEGAQFCGECGTRVAESPGPQVFEQNDPRGGIGGRPGYTQGGGKRGGKGWILLLILLALLVLGLGAAVFLFLRGRTEEAVTEESSGSGQESSVSTLPPIGQTTPPPGESGASSGEESGGLPQLPALFGQSSEETVPDESAEESAAAGGNSPAETPEAAPSAAPGVTTPVPTVQLTPVPPPAHVDSTDVHRYDVVIRDVTWNEAWNDAISRGGHLARINSAAEMQAVCDLLNAQNATSIHFYLGGSCDTATKQYHWMDADGTYFDEVISDQSSWYGSYWYPGEPSYVDTELARNGRTVEEYWMNLFCVSGTWYFNDATYDLVGMYPDWLKGKVGYIVEYE